MPLPAPNLDDRTFQDIVDETKRRIPEYCPAWTNHNLSDPGVALIELFAWMTEMVLYRLNQVPDRLYTKFLDLIGIQPFAAGVARTDLTFWLTTILDRPVIVPEGTVVAADAGVGAEVLFSTLQDLRIEPPQLVAALTGTGSGAGEQQYRDVRSTLGLGRPVTVFDPLVPGASLYLGFASSIAGALVRLTVSALVRGVGIRPDDPPLRWSVWDGTTWRSAPVLRRPGVAGAADIAYGDTTGGLNQDGTITLHIPPRMERLTLREQPAFWLRLELLEPRPGQPGYQDSPVLTSVTVQALGGTVGAEHTTLVEDEDLGVGTGVPGLELSLTHAPIVARRPDEHLRVLSDGTWTDWVEVADFSRSGPGDPHYTLDGATGTIAFGPRVQHPGAEPARQHGAVVPDGARIRMARYRHGGGAIGNVPTNSLRVLRQNLSYIGSVTNLEPATGGMDPETPANAKLRGPLTFRTSNRAVTVEDFEQLTRDASRDVARVRCLAPSGEGMGAGADWTGWGASISAGPHDFLRTGDDTAVVPAAGGLGAGAGDLGTGSGADGVLGGGGLGAAAAGGLGAGAGPTGRPEPIRLLVVPTVDTTNPQAQQLDDFALEPELVQAITSHLAPRRVLGSTFELGTPFYQGVSVAVLLRAGSRSAELVRQDALERLYRFVHPTLGGRSGTGWPFGEALHTAPIAEMLRAVPGVEDVIDVLLFEYDLRGGTEAAGQRVGAGRDVIPLDEHSLFLSAHHQVVVRGGA